MESLTIRPLKRKDSDFTADSPTKRVRTTDDGQAVPSPTSSQDAESPDSQLNVAHEVDARPDVNDREDSGKQGKPAELEKLIENDSSDEDDVGNEAYAQDDDETSGEERDLDDDSEEEGDADSGGKGEDKAQSKPAAPDDDEEDDYLLLDQYNAGELTRPDEHYADWESREYEKRLADKYQDVWGKAQNSLLSRRLTDLFDDKGIWHSRRIDSITNVAWDKKEATALREHEWARQWLGDSDVAEEKWGSRILYPHAPSVRVQPLRRLSIEYRGEFLPRSRLSKCIYPESNSPPTADTQASEAVSSDVKTADDAAATTSKSIPDDLVEAPCAIGGQADLVLEHTPDVAKGNTVVEDRRVRASKPEAPRHHHNAPYEPGHTWQDSEPLMWEMMTAMPLPL